MVVLGFINHYLGWISGRKGMWNRGGSKFKERPAVSPTCQRLISHRSGVDLRHSSNLKILKTPCPQQPDQSSEFAWGKATRVLWDAHPRAPSAHQPSVPYSIPNELAAAALSNEPFGGSQAGPSALYVPPARPWSRLGARVVCRCVWWFPFRLDWFWLGPAMRDTGLPQLDFFNSHQVPSKLEMPWQNNTWPCKEDARMQICQRPTRDLVVSSASASA